MEFHNTVTNLSVITNSGISAFACASLFQSLLLEAWGRTVNPMFGEVGLLSDENGQATILIIKYLLLNY